jgi:alcohol dehydrogenase YqhD (iron-dependent ADH family)
MSHIFEVYFNNTEGAFVQNRMAEALLKTCINYGRKAIDEPDNYEARANLMWASSLAINGLLSYGVNSIWSVHPMEHELSAFYDITHGVGLAILTPHWMEYVLNENTVDKFVEYGVNVWGLEANEDKFKTAHSAIEKTKEFFASLNIPSTLREVGINEEKLEKMASQAARGGTIGNFRTLSSEDVLKIFKAAL